MEYWLPILKIDMLINFSKKEVLTLWEAMGLLRLDYMDEKTIVTQEPVPTLTEEERIFFEDITALQKKLGTLANLCNCHEK